MADVIEIDAEVTESEYFTADYGESVGGADAVASYTILPDKPSINGVSLVGNKTTEDLGLLDDVPDFTPVSGSTPAVAGLVPSTGGHTTLDDVRVLTDEGWQTLSSYLDTSSKNPPKSYAVFDYINAHTVNDVKVNGTSAVTSGTANINNFVGGSPSSANNKAGLVPQPPTLDETGQMHILTDAYGWLEAYPQMDNKIPFASKYIVATPSGNGLMSKIDKAKLDGIEAGAEANVQADWSEGDSTSNAYIANKPTIHNVPSGGASGQVLSKASEADYDLEWVNQSGGGGTITDVKLGNASVVRDGIAIIPAASSATPGYLSQSNYTKLAGISAGAEVNQNAFSTVKVGTTSLEADSKTDTLTITAGDNITLTPTASSDSFTIAATDTTYSDATTSAHGLMSATDKSKLDSITMTNGVIDASVLPSFVDDVVEAYPVSGATELSIGWLSETSGGSALTPESGKIYVLMTDATSYSANSQFRWGGSAYVKLNDGGVSSVTNAEIDAIVAL